MRQRRFKEIFISSSDPFERGIQHGSQVKDNILAICEGYKNAFAQKGFTWQEAQAMALAYVPALDRETPDLMQEARGIAKGADVDLSIVMLLNLRYELLKLEKKTPQPGSEDAECTCFSLLPEATGSNKTYSGQNWDKNRFVEDQLYVIHIDELNGTKILGLSEPAQLIRNGMNSYGITLNCATLLSTLDSAGHALPTNFMRRRLLQCQTFDEAVSLIEKFKPDVSLNYVITSVKEGRAAAFETCPRENFRIDPLNGIIAKANDFVCDPAIDRFIPASKDHVRHFRAQRLNELFKKRRGNIDVDYIMSCLRDHYGHPDSICNHDADADCFTIASMIYDPLEGCAWMAWGNPCENSYENYRL